MRLGWGRDDGPFFFSCPARKPHERCERGPILLCMGLFSRFCVWAPRCTAGYPLEPVIGRPFGRPVGGYDGSGETASTDVSRRPLPPQPPHPPRAISKSPPPAPDD